MRRVFVDPEAPQRDAIEEAATWIRRGGLVALPTDTLYGLAADPFSNAAVTRLFEAKGRAAERALPLIAADSAQVAAHLGRLSAEAERLAATFWPGPVDAAHRRSVRVGAGRDLRHRRCRRARSGRRGGAARFARRAVTRSPRPARTSAVSRRRRIPTRWSVRSATVSTC